MPIESLIIPIESECYYHVYNRGNNKEKLFDSNEDYQYFLRKYRQYLDDYVETYAYCLLPNHFHFLIFVNKGANDNGTTVSNQFRKLFISYVRRYNHKKRRSGCLVARNFRRILVEDESYLKNLVLYIHYNPVKHGLTQEIIHYPYSSFSEVIGSSPAYINRHEVLSWYDGLQSFLVDHHLSEIEQKIGFEIQDD